jgi:hypothetical protein
VATMRATQAAEIRVPLVGCCEVGLAPLVALADAGWLGGVKGVSAAGGVSVNATCTPLLYEVWRSDCGAVTIPPSLGGETPGGESEGYGGVVGWCASPGRGNDREASHRRHTTPMTESIFPDREELRRHLVADHSWPEVARYDVTFPDLDTLHRDMHEPSLHSDLVPRVRRMLGMPYDWDDE